MTEQEFIIVLLTGTTCFLIGTIIGYFTGISKKGE